ncbi:MAG: histidine kinase [Actinomycetota bacterium]
MSDSAGTRFWSWLRADLRRFDLAVALLTLGVASALITGSSERFDSGWPEVAAGVGAFALVLFRRVQPFLFLAIALVWTAVHVAVWDRPTPTVFAAVVLLATSALRLERWPAIALGASIGGSLYVLGLIGNDAELGDSRAVIGIVWSALAIGIADAVRSWRRYRESAEAQLRSTVEAAEANTRRQVSEERLAIARELHDLLAHNLSVMNVQTGAAQHLLRSDPDQAEESLQAARDAGRNVLDELRELLAILRHDDGSDGEPTSSLPTADQLPALVDTIRSTGLDVDWTRAGEARPLTPAVSLAAYRIVQEGLTNAAKHGAGSAHLVTEWTDDELSIHLSNPAAARSGEGSGLGLVGMRERATANGGDLSAELVAGKFVVEVNLPTAASREAAS